MDKSRSSRHYQEFPKFAKNKSEEKLPIIDDKLKVSVTQKEGKSNKKGSPKKGKSKNKSPASANNKSRKSNSKNTLKSQSPKKGANTKKK
jgi:hypothetical protein